MDKQALNLRDIHLPEAISWWPLASGWWLLLACLVLLAVIVFFIKKAHKSKQLNREVNIEIKKIKTQFRRTKNKYELAQSLSLLLRRSSISFYSEKDVAGLTGEQWLAFLDGTTSETNSFSNAEKFQSKTGNALIVAPYLPKTNDFDFDAQALVRLCENWLKTQKVSAT
jgi:hypothetical protein